MKLYEHKDYNEYVDAQIEKNIRKLKHVWVKNEELRLISKKIKQYIKNPTFGICHGVRNGTEVKVLRKLTNIKILGTDISPTASQFKHTIQWDFHKIKDEWINNVDFIYSNSFDHSYKPDECLDTWMKCIKKNGLCFIHWMDTNIDIVDAGDCFAGSLDDYRSLINNKYEILEEFYKYKGRTIFVIKHKGDV